MQAPTPADETRARNRVCFDGTFGRAYSYWMVSKALLARIMQQVQGFCMSVEQACVGDPIGWIVVRQLAVRRVWG
jgi:hypothetical protein